MATLHTHNPAAALLPLDRPRPTNLMHNTHACTPTLPTARTWAIERVSPATLGEASLFVNASRRLLFPSLGYNALLDDARVLESSCVLVARDRESHAVVAAIVYVPFDYRFPHLPWPVGISCQSGEEEPTGTTRTSTPTSSSPSSWSSSSSSFTTNTTPNSSTSSLVALPKTHAAPTPPSETPTGHLPRTVEVLRLFVMPEYRRHGLAAALFDSLKSHALASGVHFMYLHTHPFLPGAIRFWQKQGFEIIHVDEEDEVWQTHHMQMMLAPPESDDSECGK